MNQTECEKIIELLDTENAVGVPLLNLTRKSKIRITKLLQFLRSHKEFFEPISISFKYRLSQRAPFYGNAALIRKALLKELDAKQQEKIFTAGVIWFSTFTAIAISLFAVFMNNQ